MSKVLEYLKKKRNSLLNVGKKRSQKACKMLDSIKATKKGECIKIPVHKERDVHNIRAWLSHNKKYLKPEDIDIHTAYKRKESILYIYVE